MERSQQHEPAIAKDQSPNPLHAEVGTTTEQIAVTQTWASDVAPQDARCRLFRPEDGLRMVESIPSYEDWR